MKIVVLRRAAVLSAICMMMAGSPLAAQEPSTSDTKSVWEGVYTAEQAKRGEAAYKSGCSSCHGDTLKGAGESPALAGSAFMSNWSGLPLEDLYERIRRSMPQDNPARITRQQKLDIVAYILSMNKFPNGNTDLPRQPELLKLIRIQANKPDSKQ
jgi:S-disulfanyl-L-cysteine oxidoreductase SoxD